MSRGAASGAGRALDRRDLLLMFGAFVLASALAGALGAVEPRHGAVVRADRLALTASTCCSGAERAVGAQRRPARTYASPEMLVLLGFAVLAGAGTALSPCVLPVLPALLSAGGVGGRRRPLGIVLGLSITFTVTIVGVAQVVDGVGSGSDPLRDVAIVVLLVFGAALLRAERRRRASRRRSRGWRASARARAATASGRGCSSAARSASCTRRAQARSSPRSSPSARRAAKRSRSRWPTRCGSAVVLLALTLGGRRLFDRVRKAGRGPLLQRALGTIMILTAVAIIANARRQLRPVRRRSTSPTST